MLKGLFVNSKTIKNFATKVDGKNSYFYHCLGWFYELNIEIVDAGGNGCNPPWAIIGPSEKSIPDFCC